VERGSSGVNHNKYRSIAPAAVFRGAVRGRTLPGAGGGGCHVAFPKRNLMVVHSVLQHFAARESTFVSAIAMMLGLNRVETMGSSALDVCRQSVQSYCGRGSLCCMRFGKSTTRTSAACAATSNSTSGAFKSLGPTRTGRRQHALVVSRAQQRQQGIAATFLSNATLAIMRLWWKYDLAKDLTKRSLHWDATELRAEEARGPAGAPTKARRPTIRIAMLRCW
jgi:hypothetical protein